MTTLMQDIRYAFRAFVRTPGQMGLILITLGLGIGATTAIFSAVNEVMLRPLSFADPDRLVMLWESNDERGWQQEHAAPANVLDWRERVTAFQDVAFVSEFTSGAALTGLADPVQVIASQVSGNTFSVLGASPMLGRTFTFEETWAPSEPTVVLSHDAWQRYFGGDADIIGKTIHLDAVGFQVIGVMGPSFRYGINDAELWVPFLWTEQRRAHVWFRQAHVVRPIARLRTGVSHEQAAAELASIAGQLQQEYPNTNEFMEAGLTPLHRFLTGDRRLTLLLLLGAVGVLQLIACGNVANLLMTRAVSRRQEIAVRSALGAGRSRITRQVLTESFVIAVLGAFIGMAIGFTGLQWINALRPPELPSLSFRLDWRLLSFTVAVTGISAIVFGALPALRSARLNVADQLTDGSRIGSRRNSLLAANGLVSLEIGLAVLLVVGAGLMVRSLRALRTVDSGVDITNVLTFEITPPAGTYRTDTERAEFVAQFLEQLQTVPGVVQTGGVRRLPYQGFAWTSDFTIDNWATDQFGVEVRHREATPGYFTTMGVPLLSGALFKKQLSEDEAVPVVVNRAFADRYFPNESPVGRRIVFDRSADEQSNWHPIVGVVGNERLSVTADPMPEVIAHLIGDPPRTVRIAIKTSVPPLGVMPEVRSTLHTLNADIPIVSIRTMEEVASEALASDRFLMTLLSVFAVVALGLAAIGVYGVAAQAARARTREIGIRLALGATGPAIIGTLVTRGMLFAGGGVLLGLAGAALGGRVVQGVLFGIEPSDPTTLLAVAVILITVAAASSYIPAWRATKVDPVKVLKAN